MRKLLTNAEIVGVVYTVGFACWILYIVLRWTGNINIKNKENMPRLQPGWRIVSNHPDACDCMLEILLIPGIFFTQMARHPLKMAPCFTPDQRNFTDKPIWFWLRPLAVSIRRDHKNSGSVEARRLLNVAKGHEKVMMLLPEGGRTCTLPAENSFQYSNSGRRRIRPLRDSLGWLAQKSNAPIFLMWIEEKVPAGHQPGKRLFSWPTLSRGPITIKFGPTLRLKEELTTMDRSQLTSFMATRLLELADQE